MKKIIVILLVLALIVGGLYFSGAFTHDSQVSAPTPLAVPPREGLVRDLSTPPLPEKDTYFISGKEPGPKIYEAAFDPLGNIAPGATQKITVKVRHTTPVDTVKVTMILDDNSYPLTLTRESGSPEDGTWKGEWVVPKEYEYTFRYQAEIEAKSGAKTSRAVLTFR